MTIAWVPLRVCNWCMTKDEKPWNKSSHFRSFAVYAENKYGGGTRRFLVLL